MIARNDVGTTLQAWSITKDRVNSPVVADIEAVCVALLVTQQNRNIKIQINIKVLAHCLQLRKIPVVEATLIAKNIYLLAMIFESCKFSFGHKSYNRASWK